MSSARLLLDVGNTGVKAARLADGQLALLPAAPLEEALHGLPAAWPALPAIVSSVIGARTAALLADLAAHSGAPARLLGRDLPLPLPLRYRTPETLGGDRVLAAAGAWRRAARAAIVLDAGTALKVDGVDAQGHFVGGAIGPGWSALVQGLGAAAPALTAFLPGGVPAGPALHWPGDSSAASVAAGLEAALVGGARELLAVARARLGARTPVYVAGGDAAWLAARLREPGLELAPHLVLEGLALAVERADG